MINKERLKGFISTISVFMKTYRYRIEITNSKTVGTIIWQFIESAKRVFFKRKRILFYPDGPRRFHALYKILLFSGYRYATDENSNYDVAIKWWLAFDGYPFAPENAGDILQHHQKNGTITLNNQCNDISKQNINTIFEEIFEYPISIDPRIHVGKCVKKSNWNALHEGEIINCPMEDIEENAVYQKVINNELEDGTVVDMRVPIFGEKVPFVYLKYRPIDKRFIDRTHSNLRAKIVKTADVLNLQEIDKIIEFCKKLGLDYGEIDVLRDKDDSRIYIVDANNTPSGPTSCISNQDEKAAVLKLAEAFETSFGR
jgi:hypothetical protein